VLNRGVHEPLEEYVFQELLKNLPKTPLMIELGAYCGHYSMLVRLTPKNTRFGDDLVGTLAHWLLAGLSPLHFGCCHEPVYSPSYVGDTACPLIPSNDRNALNG
jgi:hypothetical protein